ncbi:MAG: peptidase [Clostridia bacterium]|nr:peptidase [Clostridia bacterium]
MPFFYMDYWYLILVVPAIIFSLIAQARVNSTYNKYSRVASKRKITGREIAESILHNNNIYDVRIEHINGRLNDHYNPKEKVIRLSDEVYNGNSVAALGIAAHEAGHTVQHYNEYFPIQLRNVILPVANIGSTLSMPMILIGFIFNFSFMIDLGIIFFGTAVLFQFVTLPVEFNASSRAMKSLENSYVLDEDELGQTKKVLSAAAMTYIAALAVSLAQFLRLLIISGGRRRD